MKKKNKKSLKITLVYLLVIAFLSLAAYSYKWIDDYLQESLSTFKLVDIDIKGNKVLSRKDVLALCGLKPGQELLTIKPVDVVKKLCRSPYIKAAGAVRSLPSTLRIVIKERKPIAFIYGRGLNLIDDEGYLIPVPRMNRRWNLPFITGVNEPLGTLGEKTISRKALKGVEILSYAKLMSSSINEVISEINLKNSRYLRLLLIKGGSEARLDYDNYQENLYVLSQYFEKYLDWNKLAVLKYIDVRFKNQLIIKEKQG